jgi:F-type H+-transporting ATPase subunit delta
MEEIARVYARSLFEVASEQGRTDEIREQLGELVRAMEEDRDLQVFFFSPYFSTKEKADGLDRAISGADDIFVNFLKLLIENHRMPVIFRVRRGYEELWEEANRLLPVSVTSAVELDEATVRELGDRIAEQTGRRVDMSTHVDADILGGIVVRVGNSVLDASVRNRLDQLRRNVARAA